MIKSSMTDERYKQLKSEIDPETLKNFLEKYKEKYDAEGLSQEEREKKAVWLIARFSMR